MARSKIVRVVGALALVLALAAPGVAGNDKAGAVTGVRAGYNMFNTMVDMVYEEHPDVTMWHLGAYGGYDFGVFRITGTLWNYVMNISEDGIWRVDGDDPIDQTFVEAGSGGFFGPSVDVWFDVPVHERVIFHPGVGAGIAFRYGEIKQFDYETKTGFGDVNEEDLTQDQIQPEAEDNGKSFIPVWPLIHVSADWLFLINDNLYCRADIAFQTFGPTFGLGFGYHF
ncbi:hypothetical protein K8I61_14305 [bacterium]|nr:hypothetical protein [bacterium]